ncbi:hypothetical protein [Prochlorococcus sp. MIT 1223]|nr:hypothetical protein [Prochlorococcus sp. MIT 1223]
MDNKIKNTLKEALHSSNAKGNKSLAKAVIYALEEGEIAEAKVKPA